MSREHISTKTVLAAAICQLLEIPHEHAKLMHEEQVISLIHRDHYPVRRADGLAMGMTVEEVDHHSNIFLRPIMSHREKTAREDIPQMAKSKRVRLKQAKHAAAIAAKTGQSTDGLAAALAPLSDPSRARPKPKRAIQSRGFTPGRRPLRSRNTFQNSNRGN